MRIVIIDIDTLRPDHLGCYGYHRNTSPNIDRICRDGVRFDQCFVPDAPCLPSRAALHHGRFGFHNGAVNHGGVYAEPYGEGPGRQFRNTRPYWKWMQVMQEAGFYTATVSSFAGRHNSWWFHAGFHEVYDCAKGGGEIATEVTDHALDFIQRNKNRDQWLLHFNIWDPHCPYRTPEDYGNPFADDPAPDWLTQELLDAQWNSYGPHSANAVLGRPDSRPMPREVAAIRSPEDFRKWIDGYDVGIRFADDAVGRICGKLEDCGLYEETAVIVTSDHGENQGELNVYGDHQTADLITCRVPMIVKWPGIPGRADKALHYQFDIAATVVDLVGRELPGKWDAASFKDAFLSAEEKGRDYLVVSQAAWSCQRTVVFDDYLLIKTYMDGLKDFPQHMLFHRFDDPHETANLADSRPDLVDRGLALLNRWVDDQMMSSDVKEDPLMKVIQEGGPYHTRGSLPMYLEYYRKAGRGDLADRMERKYGRIAGYREKR